MVTVQTNVKHVTEKELRFPASMTAGQFHEAVEVVRSEWKAAVELSLTSELTYAEAEDRFLKEVKVSANATNIVFSYEIVELDAPVVTRISSNK